MAKESSLVKLAKGSGKKATPAKKVEKIEPEKVLTPAEERDIKAKAKVEQLLEGVELTPKKEELLELDAPPKEGHEWLEEQVSLLGEQVETLKAEVEVAKGDYARIFAENQRIKNGGGIQDDSMTKQIVLRIFNELQESHLSMGNNPHTGAPNLVIAPIAFMNRLIMYFPFLEQHKKF